MFEIEFNKTGHICNSLLITTNALIIKPTYAKHILLIIGNVET